MINHIKPGLVMRWYQLGKPRPRGLVSSGCYAVVIRSSSNGQLVLANPTLTELKGLSDEYGGYEIVPYRFEGSDPSKDITFEQYVEGMVMMDAGAGVLCKNASD